MAANRMRDLNTELKTPHPTRKWAAAALAAACFLLYAAASFGWFAPLADGRWAARAEPVLILAIGYYFGRLPARRMEEAFGEALARQAQKAEAAQHAKELAQQAGEVLEERLKNAKMILAAARQTRGGRSTAVGEFAQAPAGEEALRQSVAAALSILES